MKTNKIMKPHIYIMLLLFDMLISSAINSFFIASYVKEKISTADLIFYIQITQATSMLIAGVILIFYTIYIKKRRESEEQ